MIPLYTAICGCKYPIQQRKDIICFRDEGIFKNPIMEAKRYKLLPHLFFDEKITIWIDANIQMLITPEDAVKRFLGKADMAIFAHPHRDCFYDEFTALRKNEGRFKIPWLQEQLKQQEDKYRSELFPAHYGLWECNFIIRRNNPKVNNLMNAWWAEICRWQWRDQVSFPYILRKHGEGIVFNTILGPDIRCNPSFKYTYHT